MKNCYYAEILFNLLADKLSGGGPEIEFIYIKQCINVVI